jgi:hypothetical protein
MRATRKVIEILLVIPILLAGCGSAATKIPPQTSPQITAPPEATAEVEFGKPFSDADDYIEGARRFNPQEALKHVEYLASDALEGRLTGTTGNLKAGDYIAARLAEYGLQPAGVNGSYFQPFDAAVTTSTKQPALTVSHPDSGDGPSSRSYTAYIDFIPRVSGYIGSGDVKGQVVWFGYCNRSDLFPKVSGKIILCKPSSSTSIQFIVEKSIENKIAGVLLIREDEGPYGRSGFGLGDLIEKPAFGISRALTGDLLAGTQYTFGDLDALEVPTELPATVHRAASFERNTIEARNVLGLLPGTDPQHKDEIVVVSAHYDHVGRDPDGTIYNGANDNATGVAVMLEIAHLWQSQGYQPARSVLFAAWDAEEQGLYGSQYYVLHPVDWLAQTAAMLNLEMDGVGSYLNLGGQSAMADQLQASAAALGFTAELDPAGGSDDINFQDAGIPAGVVSIYPASDLDLAFHRPEDDPRHIQINSLRTVGILAAHALAAWCGGGPVPATHD